MATKTLGLLPHVSNPRPQSGALAVGSSRFEGGSRHAGGVDGRGCACSPLFAASPRCAIEGHRVPITPSKWAGMADDADAPGTESPGCEQGDNVNRELAVGQALALSTDDGGLGSRSVGCFAGLVTWLLCWFFAPSAPPDAQAAAAV